MTLGRLLRSATISLACFAAFYAAGCFALYFESFHQSIVASMAIFGVSFVSLIGGAFKIWHDIFG